MLVQRPGRRTTPTMPTTRQCGSGGGAGQSLTSGAAQAHALCVASAPQHVARLLARSRSSKVASSQSGATNTAVATGLEPAIASFGRAGQIAGRDAMKSLLALVCLLGVAAVVAKEPPPLPPAGKPIPRYRHDYSAAFFAEAQRATEACTALCQSKRAAYDGDTWEKGPCLSENHSGEWAVAGWACDVARHPRAVLIDNEPVNLCSDYLAGRVTHLVEVRASALAECARPSRARGTQVQQRDCSFIKAF